MYRSVNVIEESSPLGCHTLALFVLDIGERLNVIKFGHRLSVTDLLVQEKFEHDHKCG